MTPTQTNRLFTFLKAVNNDFPLNVARRSNVFIRLERKNLFLSFASIWPATNEKITSLAEEKQSLKQLVNHFLAAPV